MLAGVVEVVEVMGEMMVEVAGLGMAEDDTGRGGRSSWNSDDDRGEDGGDGGHEALVTANAMEVMANATEVMVVLVMVNAAEVTVNVTEVMANATGDSGAGDGECKRR